MNRIIVVLGLGLGLLDPPRAALGFSLTYNVDAVAGDDSRSPDLAQSSAFPWKTTPKGIFHAEGGDTIMVNPGTYFESVESKRDGWSKTADDNIKDCSHPRPRPDDEARWTANRDVRLQV